MISPLGEVARWGEMGGGDFCLQIGGEGVKKKTQDANFSLNPNPLKERISDSEPKLAKNLADSGIWIRIANPSFKD